MPINNPSIKTTLRIPRALHAAIDESATASGISLNAEVLLRLQHDPHTDVARELLDELRRLHSAVTESTSKQNSMLWSALKRADGVLEKVAVALSKAANGSEAASLKHDVEVTREIISVIEAHR